MSDSDDWEKIAEKDDDALENIIKTSKFGDEILKPQVEEVKQIAPPPVSKPKIGEKLAKKKKKVQEPEEVKISAEEKNKIIAEGKFHEEIADNEITEELFDVKPVTSLVTDDDYIEYSREISRRLYKGQYHFRLPVFFKELFKSVAALMSADDIYKVITNLNVIHAEKIKAEKGKAKKNNNKPALNSDAKKGKNILGDDENDDEDFDEYGDFL